MLTSNCTKLLLILLIILSGSVSQCVYAAKITDSTKTVRLIALHSKPGKTHSYFAFLLSRKTEGRMAYFSDPKRLVVELDNAKATFDIEDLPLKNSNVSAIESEVLPRNRLRFIFYTKDKVRARALFSKDQHLRIEIVSVTVAPKTVSKETQAKRTLIPRVPSKAITLVIDAGHGGNDPGALGPSGIAEKDIVLAIAKKLALRFAHHPHIRVVLTRTTDTYVPLRERLTIARKSKADLFIALHADGYFNSKARGASVYALSERGATTESSRWLSQQENYSELGGVALNELKDKSPILRKVLIDLAQTANLRSSLALGENLLHAMKSVARLHHERVEQAPFLVLKSPDIASILVETGFLSNPAEAKDLTDPAYQHRLADALYRGILRSVAKNN